MRPGFSNVMVLSVLLLLPLSAQENAPKSAAFEVASIKANNSGPAGTSINFQGNRMNLVNVPLRAIIQLAYGISQPTRVAVPNWVNSERFDITATSEETLSLEKRRVLMQALLADRFHMVTHTETREQPAFALVLARSDGRLGPSLKHSTAVCSNRPLGAATEPAPDSPNDQPRVLCGVRPGGPGKVVLIGVPLNLVASALSVPMGRTVFDKTGLTGLFDVELSFAPELPQVPGAPLADTAAADESRPSVLSAIQDQLGLKLNSEREKIDVLVVDRIEHPTEN